MSVLIDTNILLRSAQPNHPMHATAVRAVERLLAGQEPLYIAIQNAAEFRTRQRGRKPLTGWG